MNAKLSSYAEKCQVLRISKIKMHACGSVRNCIKMHWVWHHPRVSNATYRDVEKCHNVEVYQSLSKLILTPPFSLDINEVDIPCRHSIQWWTIRIKVGVFFLDTITINPLSCMYVCMLCKTFFYNGSHSQISMPYQRVIDYNQPALPRLMLATGTWPQSISELLVPGLQP